MTTAPGARLCRDETPNVLVVEGKDDCHGIFQIAAKSGLEEAFGIWDGGNDEGALKRFGGLLAGSARPKMLGIVLDCDSDDGESSYGTRRRWAQIRSRLGGMPYILPSAPDPTGTIIEGSEGYPRLGVWLMPDNQTEGMFEDYLLRLVPAEAVAFARETAVAARVRGHGSHRDVHQSKAIAHTWLAWQDEPGKPIGIAIKSGMFDLENSGAGPFIGWLRELFRP